MMEEVELGSVCCFENGDRGKNYPSQSCFLDDGIPFISAKNLENHLIMRDRLNYISEETYDKLGSGKLQPDDILFCLRGSLGKFAVNNENMKGAIASSLVLLRVKDELDVNYLKFYLKSPSLRRQVIQSDNGSSQPNLSGANVKKFKIPLPPLETQKRIAEILDTADTYRQKTEALIEKYDELTQSLFLEMFGDPKNNPLKFERIIVGKAIKIVGGSQPPKKVFLNEAKDGYVRLVQIRDYKSDKYLTYVPENSTKKFCTATDIMIGRYGPPVFQILRGIEGAYNVALMKAIPMERMNSEFVFQLLSCAYIQDVIIGNSKRTAGQTGVNLKLLNNIEISLPPIDLQNEFAFRIQKIEVQKAQAQQSLEKAEDLFASLLQRAFKGELE